MQPARTALTLVERLTLALLRLLMRFASWFAPLRARGLAMRVDAFRYGSQQLEVGDMLEPMLPFTVAGNDGARAATPVVFVHGGGWIAGHRAVYTADLAFLVDEGRAVANLDYPLAPEAPHPEPLRALLRALAHLRAEDSRFDRVHLIGDSAGGNLAVMLALILEHRSELEAWAPGASADTHPAIASVVSIYGVLDRLSWLDHRFPMARLMLRSYGGPAALEPEVGPELAITPTDLEIESGPPMWIAYGDQDQLAESSRIGARHLEEAGLRIHLEGHPGQGHGFFNFAGRTESQRLRADISRFLAQIDAELESQASDSAGGDGHAE